MPQVARLGPLLFFIYSDDVSMALNCNFSLYADDTCLVFQSKTVKNIEKQFNQDFGNIYNLFVDNKLSIVNTKSSLSFLLLNLRSKSFRS